MATANVAGERVTHRDRLAMVLADGKWHRVEDICPTDRARKALQLLVREGYADCFAYEASWVPVMRWVTTRRECKLMTVRLRIVRKRRGSAGAGSRRPTDSHP